MIEDESGMERAPESKDPVPSDEREPEALGADPADDEPRVDDLTERAPEGVDTLSEQSAPPAGERAGELEEIVAELDEELGLQDVEEQEQEGVGEEMERLRVELESLRDQHLRLAADFDNFRKRASVERRESWVRAQADLLGRILDALDDLQRVGDYDPETTSANALHEGVALVERKMLKALSDAGTEIIEPVGEVFDPAIMEAMASVPAPSEEEDDRVREVFQKGYVFNGHLVRPARVIVQQYE